MWLIQARIRGAQQVKTLAAMTEINRQYGIWARDSIPSSIQEEMVGSLSGKRWGGLIAGSLYAKIEFPCLIKDGGRSYVKLTISALGNRLKGK